MIFDIISTTILVALVLIGAFGNSRRVGSIDHELR